MAEAVSALIVDDESVARAGLRALLDEVAPWVAVAGDASSGPAALEAIESLRPELAFLDIEMPGLSGLDVLRRATHQPYVVFTTAYAQHAVTAFELGALDYLLKPFGRERLALAMERVRAALGEPLGSPIADRLQEALGQGPMRRLFVRSASGVIPLPVEQVGWFEARGDYVGAHVGATRHLLHLSLNRLEARLDPAQFARIHRTHIVNLAQVVAFRSEGSGKLVAELKDGVRLPVSRARARDLRRLRD